MFLLLSVCMAFFLFWASSVSALSFAQGTKFLDATTKLECDALGGNFTEWYGEIYCTTSGVYSSSEIFLKAEGKTCKIATDGCNTVQILNGALWAMTQMYCEDIYGEDGQEAWSCLDSELEEQELWFLSDNDRNYYILLRDKTLTQATVERINTLLYEFSDRVLDIHKYDMTQSLLTLDKVMKRLDTEIFNLIMTYPADMAMNEADTEKYSLLQYVKFEIMILAERWKRNSGM